MGTIENKTEVESQTDSKTSIPADLKAKIERYAALGAQIDASKYKVLRGKNVVPANINRGVASIRPAEMEAMIHTKLPWEKYSDLMELPDIVNVHDFLCTEVEKEKRTDAKMLEELAKADQVRSTLKPLVSAFVALKLIPAQEAEAIGSGRGFYAKGKALADTARVLKAHYPELKGRLPVDEAYLDQAIEAGISMRDLGSDKLAMPQSKQPSELEQKKDQVFALLASRHDALRRVGAYLYGSEVDQYVPALCSHKVVRHAAAANDNAVKTDATTTTPAAEPAKPEVAATTTTATVIPISGKEAPPAPIAKPIAA